MIYVCPTCHFQLNRGEEHSTLVECVRALVDFVNQLDRGICSVAKDAYIALDAVHEAKDLANNLESRVEDLEGEIA